MSYRTFITYSREDEQYATSIFNSLNRIVEIIPFKAEVFPIYGKDFKQKIEDALSESTFMVALLTDNGIHSPWVNQEIGYAFALKNRKGRWSGLPHIFPISETQVDLTKGFISKDSTDILFIDKCSSFEYVIAKLITFLRGYVPNGLKEDTLCHRITCSCFDKKGLPFEYLAGIPSRDDMDKAFESNIQFRSYKCPQCNKENFIDMRTLLPVKKGQ